MNKSGVFRLRYSSSLLESPDAPHVRVQKRRFSSLQIGGD
jgi:hypothetical protein